jgi:nucleoside-diphosphate-sugar epimerase
MPLASHFIAAGHPVKGSTTSPGKLTQLEAKGIEPWLLDVSDFSSWPAGFFGSATLIVNIPPSKGGGSDYPVNMGDVAQAAARHGISNLIFISSTSVYPCQEGITEEQLLPRPDKISGEILLQAEARVRAEFPGAVIIRFGGLMGPGKHPGRFLSGRTGLGGSMVPVNFIALEDCIGLISAVVNKGVRGELFNGVSPDHPLREIFFTAGARALELPVPVFDPALSLEDYKLVSGDKATRDLGFDYAENDLIAYLERIRP